MARRLQLDGSAGPQELPPVDDFAIVPDGRHITAAFCSRGDDGLPAVVLIHLPKTLAADFCAELSRQLAHESGPELLPEAAP
jgi:hypothetical protein